jgi:hypothetical protein
MRCSFKAPNKKKVYIFSAENAAAGAEDFIERDDCSSLFWSRTNRLCVWRWLDNNSGIKLIFLFIITF